ncbi:MAG: HNH endonuclease [Aggregatilineales bacterium]
MVFSTTIADEVLVKCGRCCCICHKFCGTSIELHHIIPEASGGQDIEDNCIPLCFDCHADVGHYNPKHPRGRKYTADELKGHRNKWYEKVAQNTGLVTNPEYVHVDRELYKRTIQILHPQLVYDFICNFDFGNQYTADLMEPFWKFEHEGCLPDFEFLDSDIESLRSSLYSRIVELAHKLAAYAGPTQLGSFRVFSADDAEVAGHIRDEDHRMAFQQQWGQRVKELNDLVPQLGELVGFQWEMHTEPFCCNPSSLASHGTSHTSL